MRALITGITGQDGSYLAELLLSKGYDVHGLVHKAPDEHLASIRHRLCLHTGDLADGDSLRQLVSVAKPDEIYNMASQTNVAKSFLEPVETGLVSGLAVTHLLELTRQIGAKFFQPASSEIFGPHPPPQSETTSFRPSSPYASAKVYAYWSTVNYREAHGLFACNGILFNHTSERQRSQSVARKIARTAADAKRGIRSGLLLGNIDARRDWGHARDFMEAVWLMMHADTANDYVIASGESHSIREFLTIAFEHVGLEWRAWVLIDPERYGRTEGQELRGDTSRARQLLGWIPRTSFQDLVRGMVDAELAT